MGRRYNEAKPSAWPLSTKHFTSTTPTASLSTA
jgi:hypothetical protein